MKVLMIPHKSQIRDRLESGIHRIVAEYFRYLPDYGCEMVDMNAESFDIKASHAGAYDNLGPWPNVAHTHGLYWSADYKASRSEYATNANVIDVVRHAVEVTVPSPWVAEAFQRDMKFSPHVIPHGIRVEDWAHDYDHDNYVLWNKNRIGDVCDPMPAYKLAETFPDARFVTTLAYKTHPDNMEVTGLLKHAQMMPVIQRAAVYLSTTKETFGIGVLEAMAAGVPVLGWAVGGNLDLVQHGLNGYLAEPGNYEDLAQGLAYCFKYRNILGANGREMAREYTWERVVEKVVAVYKLAIAPDPPTVAIIIPSYNYGGKVGRAINSATSQTYPDITSIVVVDDGSDDEGETERVVSEFSERDNRVRYIRQGNSGVSVARNRGIAATDTKYVCCLDADDAIEPTFIESLVPALENDRSIGIAYSGLRVILGDGRGGIGKWPHEFDYEQQRIGHNQVPTCCLFRRKMWERLGGYRQRYAPTGAGSEDAEFWLRAGSIGYDAIQATKSPLFIYSMGTGHTGSRDYEEVNWLEWHPWTYDEQHPFASIALPRQFSHPVRAYDEPIISVIIPVGPAHTRMVADAIDSVEAQTFRKWELILVDDTGLPTDCDNCVSSWLDELMTTYPYLRVFKTPGRAGAGYARNRGVELSRAPLILFLDADDWLKPDALDGMFMVHQDTGAAVYTDYEAHATGISDVSKAHNQVKYHSDEDGYTILAKRALEYDWRRIQRGIENPPYIWNLVSTLFPKAWHYDIGGMDENMPSWEDYDYWVRMAYQGKPFIRLPMELVVYLFHTGTRREDGHEIGGQLIHYLNEKYKEIEMSPCRGCTKSPSTVYRSPSKIVSRSTPTPSTSSLVAHDDDFVLIQYTSPNRSQIHIYGTVQFDHMMDIKPGKYLRMEAHPQGGYRFYYGRHGGGEKFYVHVEDANMERYFEPVETARPQRVVSVEPEQVAHEAPPAPTRLTQDDILNGEPEEFFVEKRALESLLETADVTTLSKLLQDEVQGGDRAWAIDMIQAKMDEGLDEKREISYSRSGDLQKLPGIGKSLADALRADGYETVDDILSLGAEGLTDYAGIGEVRAKRIIEAAKDLLK